MFAADAEFQLRTRLAAALGGNADQLSHTIEIERDERIAFNNALALIGIDKTCRVIAEIPKVVCVRSLVPKEKNSAASAITCARSAARGNSIMVPVRYSSVMPVSSATSAATVSMTALT